MDAPRWMRRHVKRCRAAFGIAHAGFDLTVVLTDVVDNDPDCVGLTTTSVPYDRAEVTLRRDVVNNPDRYEIITHELLHAATGPQREALDRILDLVPKKHRTHAEELWMTGNEATITRIARALTPLLRGARGETP